MVRGLRTRFTGLIRGRAAGGCPRREYLVLVLVAVAMLRDLSRATAGRTEQLVATWHPSAATTLLGACGDEQLPPIGRSQRALIYDTSTDALEVVRARDGSVVCEPYLFISSVLVGSLSGGGVRQALVVDGVDGRAIGSVIGPISLVSSGDGTPATIVWKGKLSGGQRDAEEGTRKIVEGVFRTGAPFVPRPRPHPTTPREGE